MFRSCAATFVAVLAGILVLTIGLVANTERWRTLESKAVAASSQQEILGLQVEVQRVQVLRQASIPSLLSKFGQDLIRDSGSNAGQPSQMRLRI